jgi:hypothetical protein
MSSIVKKVKESYVMRTENMRHVDENIESFGRSTYEYWRGWRKCLSTEINE